MKVLTELVKYGYNYGSSKFISSGAGWSSLAARRAHNPKVEGSNPSPATNSIDGMLIGKVVRALEKREREIMCEALEWMPRK